MKKGKRRRMGKDKTRERWGKKKGKRVLKKERWSREIRKGVKRKNEQKIRKEWMEEVEIKKTEQERLKKVVNGVRGGRVRWKDGII